MQIYWDVKRAYSKFSAPSRDIVCSKLRADAVWKQRQCDSYNRKLYKYVCITTNHPDSKSNPNSNPNPNPTTKQHAMVNIQIK